MLSTSNELGNIKKKKINEYDPLRIEEEKHNQKGKNKVNIAIINNRLVKTKK